MLKHIPRLEMTPGQAAVLPLGNSFRLLPETVTIDGVTWFRKKEFHVTMLLKGHLEKNLEKIRSISRRNFFEVQPGRKLRRVIKKYTDPCPGQKETIILMCQVWGSEQFYADLEDQLDLVVEGVPHHVTLYTLDDAESREGIRVFTPQELAELTTEIVPDAVPPELQKFLKHL